MSSASPPATAPGLTELGHKPLERARGRARLAPAHLALAGVLALSAVLNVNKLSQNGYANIFYSAGVKSMLRSWHNFLFVSFDPGGLVTVDKPPLALWVQAASAKVFGFSPLSLLLPEAIVGVLAVAALYWVMAPRFGAWAAVAGALTLAVFPSFVAVSRENGVDPVLILLLILACGAGLRACETGRWRTLVGCGVLIGLAFNTKTLAAYLVVPPIALAYLVCAPGQVPRRVGQLAVAAVAMLVVSFAWIAFVELTPASQRPYVGSSTNNTELGLTFEYNGFGRVEGQAGGPNSVVVRPGAYVPAARERAVAAAARTAPPPSEQRGSTGSTAGAVSAAPGSKSALAPSTVHEPTPTLTPIVTRGREKEPIPFGGPPRLLRLFGVGLGDQAGWMLPFALFGLFGVALLISLDWRGRPRERPPTSGGSGAHEEHTAYDAPPTDREPSASMEPAELVVGRGDRRLAGMLVLGGWFLVEAAVLSLSKGIVHPYYVSALGPGTGAMAGAGAAAFVGLARGRDTRRIGGLVLMACAVASTVVAQVVLLHREHYLEWFIPLLVVGAVVGLCALLALRRLALPAVACTFLLLLVAPTAYSATTWLAPAEGTFPAAGPRHDPGPGAYGVDARDERIDQALADYVSTHDPGSRWALLTVASDTASPMMLFGLDAGALGGYSGTDPAVDGPRLARLVASGQARYVLLGGEYSLRGGNLATRAVLRACTELAPSAWHSPVPYPYGLALFDCAGHERALAAAS
jgi:4-amino-4-deoxy-L-arabinose transferase-like glycosyltransferase